ncbi:hypothetical protein [Slackia sp.]|uniref:hypothetical protein n=1 Tax=Slackia sp. TaxID=2049041 RepID=UPI003A97AEB6
MEEKDAFEVGCEGMRLELIRVADDMTLASSEVRGVVQALRAFELQDEIGDAMRILANEAEKAAQRVGSVEAWAIGKLQKANSERGA